MGREFGTKDEKRTRIGHFKLHQICPRCKQNLKKFQKNNFLIFILPYKSVLYHQDDEALLRAYLS